MHLSGAPVSITTSSSKVTFSYITVNHGVLLHAINKTVPHPESWTAVTAEWLYAYLSCRQTPLVQEPLTDDQTDPYCD